MTAPRILFAYRFLSLGGVEVVLRARMNELLRRGIPTRALFGEEFGGAELFADLPGLVEVAHDREVWTRTIRDFAPDWVLVIDSPEMLPVVRDAAPDARIVYEVHSPYPQAQAVLLARDELAGIAGLAAPSPSHAELVADLTGGRWPISVIDNPLSPSFLAPGRPDQSVSQRVVAWVGRLDPLKNWRAFLEIAGLLADTDASFWLIGGKRSAAVEQRALETKISCMGLGERFRWLPAVRADDMAALLRGIAASGGCLVSTSWAESFGLTALEAMACQCPVVVPRVVGLVDLVRDGDTGRTYQPGDLGEAARQVRAALRRDTATTGMIERAAALAVSFTPARAVDSLLASLRDFTAAAQGSSIGPAEAGAHVRTTRDPGRQALRRQMAALAGAAQDVLNARDAQVVELQSELLAKVGDRDETIYTLQAGIDRASADIVRMQGVVAEKTRALDQLHEHLAAPDKRIAELDAQVCLLRARSDGLDRELQAIHSSKLWRLAGLYWRVIDVLAGVGRRVRCVVAGGQSAHVPGNAREHSDEVVEPAPAEVAPGRRAAARHLPALRSRSHMAVVIFPIIDWDFRFQRPQQLVTQLAARGHHVFYLKVSFSGGRAKACELREIAPGITEVTLPGPVDTVIYRDDLGPALLAQTRAAIAALLAENDVTDALLIVQFPFWAPLAAALADDQGFKLVYDCMDDHSGFGTHGPTTLTREEQLIERADLVVVSSRVLERRIEGRARRLVRIGNAGDFSHFNGLPDRSASPLAALPRPVIGYYGAIAEWFDTEAVRLAAERHPQWSFVLIGHTVGAQLGDLTGRGNVTFPGEVPYLELPAMLAAFDVCVIPFQRLPLTEATNPVKVFEYLATGKPVVARRLPELEPLADVVDLYDTPEEFVAGLERAVDGALSATAERRTEVASANTWQARTSELWAAVTALYPRVVIIIISYQGLEHTRRCLESIFAATAYPNFRVIVLDNGSSEDVESFLTEFAAREPRLEVILNRANLGFAAANNLGCERAGDAEVIVLLNNDTVVPPGWLSRLVWWTRDPSVGTVGPVTNWAGNEARIDVDYRSLDEMPAFAAHLAAIYRGKCFDIGVLAMFCLAMRREVLDRVGALDERFGTGMFEDDDYAKRVRLAGWRVVCAEDVFVHHHGRAAFKMIATNEYKTLFERNKRLFEEKWQEAWAPHVYRS